MNKEFDTYDRLRTNIGAAAQGLLAFEPGAGAGGEDVVRGEPQRRREDLREVVDELHHEHLLAHVVVRLRDHLHDPPAPWQLVKLSAGQVVTCSL